MGSFLWIFRGGGFDPIQGHRSPLLATSCAHPAGHAACHPSRRPLHWASLLPVRSPGVVRFVTLGVLLVVVVVEFVIVVESFVVVGFLVVVFSSLFVLVVIFVP